MPRLSDKIAIITGAASGIGAATAELFAAEGAAVMLADVDGNALEQVRARIASAGGHALTQTTDVSSTESVKSLVQTTVQQLGQPNVLFNGAGILFHGTALETTDAVWQRMIAVNLTGTFLCCREVLPAMIAAGRGSIINVASTTGAHDATPNAAAYVCSKGGVTMLTKALAVDHAAAGVRVNALCPGPTDTPMLRSILSPEQMQSFGQSLPMQRLGLPREMAMAALFLASDESSYVTGSLLTVDGGQTAQVGSR